MPALKRTHDESSSNLKSKKLKTSKPTGEADTFCSVPVSAPDEVDFPRGGGTSLTAVEVKALRDEGVKEANDEIFEDPPSNASKSHKRRRKSVNADGAKSTKTGQQDHIRIEHLNYKRVNVGMKTLARITSVQPLALIVSLSNQLFAHVPITHIAPQLTSLLERMADPPADSDGEDDENSPSALVPELWEIFKPGQYVRGVVTAVRAPGVGSSDLTGLEKSRDAIDRASRRVELSLFPERVNSGVHKTDLKPGFTLTGAVKSIEDHGYILDLGLSDTSGFISFQDSKADNADGPALRVGQLIDATVIKMSANGRTCIVSMDASKFCSSVLSEVTNASSVLPGTLVQSLITSVHPNGLNLQVLGFFDGTIEQLHLDPDPSGKAYKLGKKVKARILYDYSQSPPRFALSLKEHVVKLKGQRVQRNGASDALDIHDAYSIGTIIESATVLRLEHDRGLLLQIQPGVEGFVHISHISDEHLPSLLPSGPYKPGTVHRARVTGYFDFDGLLQLSLKPSVLAQKFFNVADVEVGGIIKGTVKKLTDKGLFVSMSGRFDGVVWPNHYADITLKHPGKRFKSGASIKCRVLAVDPERNRISLTAKKTLIDSTLPILTKLDDARPGMVCHGVIFKVFDNHLMIEFYNNLKAIIPSKEISETKPQSLMVSHPVGKVVKVRIISVERESSRIIASLRQASSTFGPELDISAVEIGNTVEGEIIDVHKENVILALQPTQVRALLSLKNLANHRRMSVTVLQGALKVGDKLEELVVVTRNPEKGIVIVANKPQIKPSLAQKDHVSLDNVTIGQIVTGRVTGLSRNGVLFKFGPHLGGILHPTDTSDDFERGFAVPAADSTLKVAVVAVDRDKKQLALSTRQSRLMPSGTSIIVDREITSLSELQRGDTVRGFVKAVADHGLFVTIGRNIDARVQIKELFDEYVKDWQPRFKATQVVKGRVLSINPELKRVELTLRSGELDKPSTSLSIADLQVGQKVDGVVKKIEDYGVFIQILSSKLSGLCHKSELSDNSDADVTVALRGFREGDRVKAAILDIKKGRISLGLKPSYFTSEELDTQNDMDADDTLVAEPFDVSLVNSSPIRDDGDVDDGATAQSDDEEMEIDADYRLTVSGPKPSASNRQQTSESPLKLTGGFQWVKDGAADDEADHGASSDESDSEEQSKKKKRKKQIELDLTADMHTKTPESNADFERLLLGSPNSSYLWIQYMSFQLQLSEVDKARDTARRALRTINFREEQEKLNVWIALLNLENIYGTDDSLESTFKDAVRHNDSKTVHLRFSSILEQSEKFQKAEELYKRTSKKFGQSSKAWTLFGEFYFRRGETEQARSLLPRSLQSLEKRKHLKTIAKFAQLEYKLGEPERGKTIFEGIIDSHPKRWDMWSVYMDLEAGQGDIQTLRNLFDRVLAFKMTSHKAKSFFKKWLELERRMGDEEGAEVVKSKAIAWTQKANSS